VKDFKRTVKVEGANGGALTKQRACLVVTEGAGVGRTYPLESERVTVGRSPEATVHVDDDQLSRFHAVVVLRDGGHEVKDLHSTNGTFVNGKRLEAARLLTHGDHVRIGQTTLRYLIEKTTDGNEHVYVVPDPPI
jgi:pSer/pThr/pTyr-binding forkhead associated (FHA) protein